MSEVCVQTEWVSAQEFEGAPCRPAPAEREKAAPRLKAVDRNQLMLRTVDVEQLIEEDHPARAIWAFTGHMDWSGFLASIQAVMHPPPTDKLYFVARGDGSSVFSRTLEEHNRAVARYQKKTGGSQ